MNKKTVSIALATVLLLVGVTAASIYGWRHYQNSQAIAEAKAAQKKMMSENVEPKDRRKMYEEMRAKAENMTESQRQAFGEEIRKGFMNQMQQRIDEFFAMSKEEQIARLDEDIQRQEKWREEREARRAEREKDGKSGERSGRDGASRQRGGGGSGEDRARRRDEFRRAISDKTTPEQRAKFQAYRDAMQERRKELGLPPGGWRGGGPRPGR